MRNLSRLYCFNKSHILEEEILSKGVDHVHLPMLGNFRLGRGITRGITSIRHYMLSVRLLGLATYKRGAPSLFFNLP